MVRAQLGMQLLRVRSIDRRPEPAPPVEELVYGVLVRSPAFHEEVKLDGAPERVDGGERASWSPSSTLP